MEVRSISKDMGISPRKIKPLADLVRGKKVDEALTILRFAPTPNARFLAKTIKSAAANAENNHQMTPADLVVVRVYAGEARMLKRFRPRSRGRVSPILRRSSHITVVVAEQGG